MRNPPLNQHFVLIGDVDTDGYVERIRRALEVDFEDLERIEEDFKLASTYIVELHGHVTRAAYAFKGFFDFFFGQSHHPKNRP